jgi:hypothetical protein
VNVKRLYEMIFDDCKEAPLADKFQLAAIEAAKKEQKNLLQPLQK